MTALGKQAHLQNKRFALNIKFQRNASKFPIFIQKENQVFFSFFILSKFHFSLMNVLVYADIDQGIHKGTMKVTLNKK